jgi:hypothetical protein
VAMSSLSGLKPRRIGGGIGACFSSITGVESKYVLAKVTGAVGMPAELSCRGSLVVVATREDLSSIAAG